MVTEHDVNNINSGSENYITKVEKEREGGKQGKYADFFHIQSWQSKISFKLINEVQ